MLLILLLIFLWLIDNKCHLIDIQMNVKNIFSSYEWQSISKHYIKICNFLNIIKKSTLYKYVFKICHTSYRDRCSGTLDLTFGTSNRERERERGCRIKNLRSQAFDGFFCTWGATATHSSFIIPTILWFWACYACKHFYLFIILLSLPFYPCNQQPYIFHFNIPSHNNKFKFIK